MRNPLTRGMFCGTIILQFLSWYRDAGKIESKTRIPYPCRMPWVRRFYDVCEDLAEGQDFFVAGDDRDTENKNHG